MALMLKENAPFTAMQMVFRDTETGEGLPYRCVNCDADLRQGDKLCYQVDAFEEEGKTNLDLVHIECP